LCLQWLLSLTSWIGSCSIRVEQRMEGELES
jgi:hypothetical protein